MPLPKGTKYRMKGGVRLAFNKAGKVIEAKNMKTGAMHSPKDFAKDHEKANMREYRFTSKG